MKLGMPYPELQRKDRFKYLLGCGVALITFLVYLSSLQNGFVLLDDDWYVYENPYIRSLDLSFLKWAFLDFYTANWHPLTWISHALDYAVWGLNPLGHHLTNNILHSVNTFLVVLLVVRLIEAASNSSKGLSRLNVNVAAVVTGLLFGLHPLHVESVAWVSERKDLLCALFYLLSVKSHLEYTRFEGIRTVHEGRVLPRFNKHYFSAVVFFVLALMSKPMASTLPLVLFILDWYPLGRIQSLRSLWCVIIERVPFVVLSIISALITVSAQKAWGALSMVLMVFEPVSSRVALAAKSLVLYLWKMILPVDLIALYPYPAKLDPLSFEYMAPAVVVIGITIVCAILIKKQKIWPAVWSYYVITLLPVLGIVQVGIQSMADRYTYLPSLGPFLIAGLVAARGVNAAKTRGPIVRVMSAAAALFIIVSMTYLTFEQIAVWRNSISLWGHVIEIEPEKVPTAYGNRGVAFSETGDLDRALGDYNRAIALDTYDTGIYFERGLVFAKMRQFDKAIADYDKAIELDKYGLKSNVGRQFYYLHRGLAYLETAQREHAISDLEEACALGSNRGCDTLQSLKSEGAR